MKTLALLFALSLYLLLPNPTHSTRNPIRLPTAASDTPVLDTDGDELQAGGAYYILSAIWTRGGVRLVRLDFPTICASDVIIADELDVGNPITITPADPNATVVLPSTFQSFRFFLPLPFLCVSNVSWEVQYDRRSGQRFVKAGDVVSYQFKIELVSPVLNAYEITYCESGTDNCYNVGAYFDRRWRATRLALTDSPWIVVFQKAGVV